MSSFKQGLVSYRMKAGFASAALLTFLFALASSTAYAGKVCANFTVTLSDGRTFGGNQSVGVAVAPGATAQVRGSFVSYTIQLDTFTVTDYTLKSNVTGNQPLLIFVRKQPLHGKTLTSNMTIELNNEQAVFQRSGGGVSMKIQSKDCSEGGIFQMEPEPSVEVEHQLAPGLAYCVDAAGRVLIVGAASPFVGRESPELATLSFPAPQSAVVGTQLSRWRIQSGGRMGLVTGEDAVEPLGAPCSASANATPTPTPNTTPTPGGTPTPSPSATPSPSPTASPSPTPAGVEAEIEIKLAGALINGVAPEGDAKLERESEGTHLRVRVDRVNLADGTVLNVLIDGVKVGAITLNDRKGEIELRTDRGQPVPPVVNGTNVTVTGPSNATLLGGTFTSSLPKIGATPTPTPAPSPQPGADLRVRIPLAGANIGGMMPQGHADFRTRADGNRTLEVEAEDVNLPQGASLIVLINNVEIGRIILGPTFEGEIELETERGRSVPAITQGTTVAVVNAATGATVLAGAFGTIAPAANPLSDSNFFVRQQYVDFLGRAPEQEGFAAWVGTLDNCAPGDRRCDDVQVSSGFYRSEEFSGRGYFVYRLYDATLGRLPHYDEFMNGMSRLSELTATLSLDAAKAQLTRELMARPEFSARFGGLEDPARAEDFVSSLERAAGVAVASHAQLVSDRRGGASRPEDTVRGFVETPEVHEHFYIRGFVAMQYFGYLRREPEADGFKAWVDTITLGLNGATPGDYRVLINGFVHAQEYRNRFGRP
ncbi:MAG TPA: hypothetical protein VF538_05420 [Pyrinomonadaceae bacterium]|jgi:hypothetical protein